MAQESRLAVTIDSRGAKRNADDLTGSLQQMERAGDAAAASAEGVSDSLEDQRRALSQLLGQINPTTAALGRLDDMQEKLAKFKKAGIVESDTFIEYTQRINTMRDALGETSDGMNRAGMSAKAYSAALRGLPERNLGTLESAWQSITGAAKKAWDAMLDVGRDQTIEDQIANTEKLIAQRKGGIIGFFAGDDDQTLRGLETRLKQLQTALANNAAKAAQDASNKATQDAGKKGIDLINSTYKSSLTQTQKLQKELMDLDKARKDAIAAGGFSAAEEEKYAKSRKNIEQEIADIKAREAKKNAPKGVNKGVSEAETTFSRLYNQYDPAAQAARTLTKEQTQLQLALDKGKISQDEYGNSLGQMAAQWAINQAMQVAFGQTSAAVAAQQIAQVGAVTAAETSGAAAVAAAKVAADGVATASSIAATTATTTAQTAAAATTASAWLPAALVASIGSFGAAAVVGGTALLAAFALIKGFATGGYVSGPGSGTSDSIPARLSNGEFVVNAKATARNRELLEAINSNERVSFAGENISLNKVQANGQAQQQAAPANVTVNLIEDRSRAGTVDQRTGDDGQLQIDAFVADIWGGGERAQAIEAAYGLSRNPT